VPTGDPPLTLADLREIPLERLKGVGPALEKRLAALSRLEEQLQASPAAARR